MTQDDLSQLKLARVYASTERGDESLQLLQDTKIEEKNLAEFLFTLDEVIGSSASANVGQAVDNLLSSLNQQFGKRINILLPEAISAKAAGDFDRSVAAYREIIQIDRDNIPAMNNLAVLLTAKPESLPEAAQPSPSDQSEKAQTHSLPLKQIMKHTMATHILDRVLT